MGWFRSSRRIAAGLALFALACQFVLSFGHVHLGRLNGISIAWVEGVDSGGNAPARPQSPQDSNGPLGDFCAICANIALAGTLVVPDAPVILLVPDSSTRILLWLVAASQPAPSDHLTFSARAPPRA
jgi:hypothetical protein